jgi:hypothetical protein
MPSSITSLRPPAAQEWVGGIVSMPTYVSDGDEPYRPEILLWLNADGLVIGTTMGKPGEVLAGASDHLRATIEKPMIGPPQSPARIRVSSVELASALRASHPSIEITCGPTPEIDQIIEGMSEHMQSSPREPQSMLTGGVVPEAMASFFRAAADLFRAKPWKLVPADDVLSVTVEARGLSQAALSVIGQLGKSFGFLLFSTMDDFEAYLDAAESIERGENPPMPQYLVLNFERGADLDPGLRKEISSHNWEVAGPQAYPWVAFADNATVPRPPTAKELALMEAVTLALAALASEKKAEKKAIAAAFAGGEPFERVYSVLTRDGEIAVTLRAPHPQQPSDREFEGDVLSDLAQLEEDGALGDLDKREPLEDELLDTFLASPEGGAVSKIEGHRLLMEYAANYIGASIATLEPKGLREVLFEIIPRKVSVDPSSASAIIEDCRAFYRFLKQHFGLAQADDCLRALGPSAGKKLEQALADPRNFGMAKSILMAGAEAGFDIQSKEGIEAWMRQVQGKPLPPAVRLPSGGTDLGRDVGLDLRPAGSRDRKKKNQRKAARKARKKNR